MRWEVRQSNFMGGYDTHISTRFRFIARMVSRLFSKRGCVGNGCTAGCTYVAREDEE